MRAPTFRILTGRAQTTSLPPGSPYTIRIEGKTDGMPLPNVPKGPQDMLMVQTARWTGASCPEGMKPGDFTLPGGMRFNIKQAKKLQKMLPNIQIR